MGYLTISEGLTIQIPTLRTEGWEETLRTECFIKISEHDHSGNGKGKRISTGSIEDDALNDLKIILRNNQYLRSKNNAGDGDINVIRVNTSDEVEISAFTTTSATTPEIKATGSVSLNDNQVVATPTGIITPDSGESYEVEYTILRAGSSELYQHGKITMQAIDSDNVIQHEYVGDAGVTLSVSAVTGALLYESTDNTDTSSTMKYLLKRMP